MTAPFTGAKLALLHDDRLLVYRRDDRADIPYPGCWDLPGGGREQDECPASCALRELQEEFGLALGPERLIWSRRYPPIAPGRLAGWLFVGRIDPVEIRGIRFGDEGQYWQMMAVDAFLQQPRAVPYLQVRLEDYRAQFMSLPAGSR